MNEADGRALNRCWWEERAPLHVAGDFYDIDRFRAGETTLQVWEREELADVAGSSLVHLQCHFGLDTLSWAREGAHVTGLDFSRNAIAAATGLADEARIPAQFVCADVYDAVAALGRTYDIVYTGHGALNWLPDLDRWAAVVHGLLRPGGRLYLSEFHPLIEVMADDDLAVAVDFFASAAGQRWEAAGSYGTASTTTEHNVAMEWTHGLGAVVTTLSGHGLRIVHLTEREETLYPRFPFLVRGADGLYRMPEGRPRVPLSYSLLARKPAELEP